MSTIIWKDLTSPREYDIILLCECSSVVEHLLAKENVESSNLFIRSIYKYHMDKEKLKLIVKNLKLLVDSLESEVYSDVDAYTNKEVPAFSTPLNDYDEIFDDDDGYPD